MVMNGFACTKLLSKMHLGPRNNLIHFGDDPDFYPDTSSPVIYVIGAQLPFCFKISI